MPVLRASVALPLLLCLVPAVSNAGGESGDIEVFRPAFGHGALPALPAPRVDAPGTVRWGLHTAYAVNPLVVYEWGEEQGAVVADRLTTTVGFGADVGRTLAIDGSMPMVGQWGSDVPHHGHRYPTAPPWAVG